MKCPKCHKNIYVGETICRYCGHSLHYGGNTHFIKKAASNSINIMDLFSGTFRKHSKGAGARMFMAGTPISTPEPQQMLESWEKPWIYMRVLGVGILFSLMSYFMAEYLGHPLGIYLLFTICALVFPISILLFFWEINIPRDIPLYHVILTFFIGGMLSLIFTLLIPFEYGEAYYAPFVEEPAKVMAIAIFIYFLKPRYIFGGLLIGAAVGAGFAAFENISYIVANGSFYLLIMRSLHSFRTHTIWAAIEGGALLIAKGSDSLGTRHFRNKQFLIFLTSSLFMHIIWNSPINIVSLPYIGDLKYIILIAAALFVVFIIIKKALRQVIETVNMPSEGNSSKAKTNTGVFLTASGGIYGGKQIPISDKTTMGYDSSRCLLVLPEGSPGVSGLHCTLYIKNDEVFIMDNNSRYGTFFKSGIKLPSNKYVLVTEPFYLGDPSIMYMVIKI